MSDDGHAPIYRSTLSLFYSLVKLDMKKKTDNSPSGKKQKTKTELLLSELSHSIKINAIIKHLISVSVTGTARCGCSDAMCSR